MRIAIVYDHPRVEEKRLAEEARKLGHEPVLFNIDSLLFRLDSLERILGDVDVVLQRAVSYFKALESTRILEAAGYTVINNSLVQLNCGDKLLTTILLAKHGVPTPRAYAAFSRDTAVRAAEELGYPVVVKPVIGSWGRLVARADSRESLEAVIEHREVLGPAYYKVHYVQEYVRKPLRDIRVFVIGDEVPVAIYRVNERHWKTNTALGAKAEPAPVTPELRELALRAAKAVGGGVLGIDVFEDPERGLLVNEINANSDFKNTERVTGFNMARAIVEYAVSVAKR
ncbi:lysine biosynthesis enzyme LysX [Pyrolobus fumarii 1A]|uniref:Lysine biosynthesis enzyme LysX n=1 Tax=Pyrolobus fumarii (strain DSM 11204 / 1A) TaxID=694429 RepID=G0EDC4_PYRF1|nr:lysine biosynthesis protein LysX [Pyrolobus fumarii]AEM38609.1 lysine biosynthesis enzyme LysX [Pyrolobus fumarii 1A]